MSPPARRGPLAAFAVLSAFLAAGLLLSASTPRVDPEDHHAKAGSHHPGDDAEKRGGHEAHPAKEHTEREDHHPEVHSHHHGDDATVHHRFEDAETWAKRFEDPARDEWQLPDRVVEALIDRPDLVIVDIGSATGYFPVRFARAVPEGFVYGADIEPGMVHHLNDRAAREGLTNLVSVLAAPDDPHLPRRVDLVYLCNTIHHIDGRIAYFDRLREMLLPGGRLAVVDWRPESERGPKHKLAAEVLEQELVQAGYRVAARHDFLSDQYFLVFEVAAE
jgi:SAM-dependent methyltransferase